MYHTSTVVLSWCVTRDGRLKTKKEGGKNRALAPPNGQITLQRPTTVGATHGAASSRSGGPGYPSGRSPPDTVGDLPPRVPASPPFGCSASGRVVASSRAPETQ